MDTGARLVAKSLRHKGMEVVFTLCGGHVQPMQDALLEEGIRVLDARDERAAAHMAHAYGRMRREVGVAMVTAGPGLTNAVTGIANAHASAAPLLVIAGAPPMKQQGKGALQELDHKGIVGAITKIAETVREARRIPHYIDRAFRVARQGCPGPVFLEIPTDVLRDKVSSCSLKGPEELMRPGGDPTRVSEAARLLKNAKRPVVLTGSGVYFSGAEDVLRALVEKLGLPYLDSGGSRGVLPPEHPLYFPGARSLALGEADLVVLLGKRLDFTLAYGSQALFHPEARFIHVDVEPGAIGHNREPDVGIVGDVRTVVEQLLKGPCVDASSPRAEWIAVLRERDQQAKRSLAPLLRSEGTPIHPYRLCGEINEVLPEDAVVVCDGGDILSFGRVALKVHRSGHWLDCGPLGCLGVGVPFAIGAKLASPGSPVLALTGDGSFGFNAIEMDTAVRHKIPIVVVVANNGAWNIERSDQLRDYGRAVASDLAFSRYDDMVSSLGGFGIFVEKPDQIRPALEEAISSRRPALVNVIVDRDVESSDSRSGLGKVPDYQALSVWDDKEKELISAGKCRPRP